jgi:hypothetical protein
MLLIDAMANLRAFVGRLNSFSVDDLIHSWD